MIEFFKAALIMSVTAMSVAYCIPVIAMALVEKMNIVDAFRLTFKWFKEDVDKKLELERQGSKNNKE